MAPVSCKAKKIILIKKRGKSIKQKLFEIVQVTDLFHTDEFIFVWSSKNGNGCQNRSSAPAIWLLRRVVAKT